MSYSIFLIYEFIFLFLKMKLQNLRNLLFFIWNMIKFPKFNDVENLQNSKKIIKYFECSSN